MRAEIVIGDGDAAIEPAWTMRMRHCYGHRLGA